MADKVYVVAPNKQLFQRYLVENNKTHNECVYVQQDDPEKLRGISKESKIIFLYGVTARYYPLLQRVDVQFLNEKESYEIERPTGY